MVIRKVCVIIYVSKETSSSTEVAGKKEHTSREKVTSRKKGHTDCIIMQGEAGNHSSVIDVAVVHAKLTKVIP